MSDSLQLRLQHPRSVRRGRGRKTEGDGTVINMTRNPFVSRGIRPPMAWSPQIRVRHYRSQISTTIARGPKLIALAVAGTCGVQHRKSLRYGLTFMKSNIIFPVSVQNQRGAYIPIFYLAKR